MEIIHFEDYIKNVNKINIHPKLEKVFEKLPSNIKEFPNLIFYGPKGVGKYSQVLNAILRYSSSGLKYEKKLNINTNKFSYNIKISDIHFEIDMSLLGCNSKMLWNDIYNNILDVIKTRKERTGIIVCTNFHEIHSELLDSFYSYMQTISNNIYIKFILITEHITFIPNNILNCCYIINVPRPSKNGYQKICSGQIENSINIEDITNIKNILNNKQITITTYKNLCNTILDIIIDIDNFKYMTLRDKLYDLFIYDADIYQSIWYIIQLLVKNNKLKHDDIHEILLKTYDFLHYYNNNYRPIYHIENFIVFLMTKIYNYK